MQRLALLAGAGVAALLTAGAAHAATPAQRLQAAKGLCASTQLQLEFTGGQSCYQGLPIPSYGNGATGLVHGGAALSGTGATYITATDASGVVHNFGSGAMRLTTSGCLCDEEASTNLILYSQGFVTDWSTTDATVTANDAVAPDGTTTAALLTSTSDTTSRIYPSSAISVSASSLYTSSVYAKAGTQDAITIQVYDSGFANQAYAICTLSGAGSCTIGTGGLSPQYATINELGSTGWYRIDLTFSTLSGTTAVYNFIYNGNAGGSVADGATSYVWGAQLENLDHPTSYIPTTTNTVTRSADTLTQPCAACGGLSVSVGYGGGATYAPVSAGVINLGGGSGGGWVNQPITSVTAVPLAAPSQAVAVGYTQLTFSTVSNFTTTTVDKSATYDAGFPWYCVNYSSVTGSDSCAATTLNSDGSVTVESAVDFAATLSTAGVSGDSWHGLAFGGGMYYEVTAKFTPTTVVQADGTPSIWSDSLEEFILNDTCAFGTANQWSGQVADYCHWHEPDVMEYLPSGSAVNATFTGNNDWYGIYDSTCTPGFCDSSVAQANAFPGQSSFTAYHRYGMLWVPATSTTNGYIKYYYDGVQVGSTVSWSYYVATTATAGANWTTSSTSITLSATCPSNLASGMTAYDQTAGKTINTITGCTGSTLALSGDAANGGSSGDTLGIGETPPPSSSTPWRFGVLDTQHLMLIIGGGDNAGGAMTVQAVNVWQGAGASNEIN